MIGETGRRRGKLGGIIGKVDLERRSKAWGTKRLQKEWKHGPCMKGGKKTALQKKAEGLWRIDVVFRVSTILLERRRKKGGQEIVEKDTLHSVAIRGNNGRSPVGRGMGSRSEN